MCQSQALGGQRCAAHTRTKFEAADPGTDAWDKAAAEFASTPTGRKELQQAVLDAQDDPDPERAIALEHALTEGQRLRARTAEVRKQLAARSVQPPTTQAQTEQHLQTIADDLGYDRVSIRRQYANTGTAVFQKGDQTHEIRFDFQRNGLRLTLPHRPDGYGGIPAQDRSGRISYYDGNGLVLTSDWNHPNDTRQVLNTVHTILDAPVTPANTNTPRRPLAPVTQEQTEERLQTIADDLGYDHVTIQRQWANSGTAVFHKGNDTRKVKFDYQDNGFRLTLPDRPDGYGNIAAQDRSGRISYYDPNGLVLTSQWGHSNDVHQVLDTVRTILTR